GLIASSESQRQIVAPEISQTIPPATAARAISLLEKRESGSPLAAGSSQASAFTSARTSGGKSRRLAPARTLIEARESFLVEALAPHRDDLAPGVQTRRDLVVAQALARQEHHL